MGQVHRLWQLLLKGHDEVRLAPDPLVSLRMALLRVLHAGQMPDPGRLAKTLESLAQRGPVAQPSPAPGGDSAPVAKAAPDWRALVDAMDARGMMTEASVLRLQVRVVELADGVLKYGRDPKFTDEIVPLVKDALYRHTQTRWTVEELPGGVGTPSLVEQEQARRAEAAAATRAHPLVKAAFEAFPDAELIEEGANPPSRREVPWSRNA